MSLELVIVVPVLLAVLALLLGYGRAAQVSGLLETAARDGARAATQARSYDQAQAALDAVVQQTLSAAPASCRDSSHDQVLGDRAGFTAGMPVTVRVWCTRSFVDVGLPIGSSVVSRDFTSQLDPYRGTR